MKTGDGERLAIAIRPGVIIPDWSVVMSQSVCTALEALFETCNWSERWAGLDEAEDATRRLILKTYAMSGKAPLADDLAQELNMTSGRIKRVMKRLAARDMLVLDPDQETITGAYPFVERDTEHRVHLPGNTLNAMCAINALGAGAMLGLDSLIQSGCRHCGTNIDIETREAGTSLAQFTPDEAIVWAGIQYDNNCAASSLCTVMAFFCSDAHLKAWRMSQKQQPAGYRLSMQEGLQMGKAIFIPRLADSPYPASGGTH